MATSDTLDTVENQIDQIIDTAINKSTNSPQQEYNMASEQSVNENEQVSGEGEMMNEENVNAFNQALNQYLRIDGEIKTLMDAIRSRNQMKRKLGETISTFLKSNKIERVDLDGSYKGKRLENKVKETSSGFRRENVVNAIHEELQDDAELFDKIMQALQRVSVMKEVWKLKITEEKATRVGRGRKNAVNNINQASVLLDQIGNE